MCGIKRKPNGWVVWCVGPDHMSWDPSHITDLWSHVMWLGFQRVWSGLMHHSNILVFFFCCGFIATFSSKDKIFCVKQLKTDVQLGTSGIMLIAYEFYSSGMLFFKIVYQMVKKAYNTSWSCDIVMWPYGMPMHTTWCIPYVITCVSYYSWHKIWVHLVTWHFRYSEPTDDMTKTSCNK